MKRWIWRRWGRWPFAGPVTLDLNGHVAVRSKGTGQVTEVNLPTSSVSGPPVRCRTNCRYLARALALGFTEFQFANADKPVACLDGPRTLARVLRTDLADLVKAP